MGFPTSNYSLDEIKDVLHFNNTPRVVDFKYRLLDYKDRYIEDLSTVENCEISFDAFADIMRTAKITLRDEPLKSKFTRVDYYSSMGFSYDDLSYGFYSGTTQGTMINPDASMSDYVTLVQNSNPGVITNWDMETLTDWVAISPSCTISNDTGYAGIGKSIKCVKTVSNTQLNGVRLNVSPLSVNAGQTIYLKFVYKLSGATTSLNKVSVYSGSNAYFITNGVITPLIEGWNLFQGSISAPITGSYGVNIGSDTQGTSTNSTIWVDCVYFDKADANYVGTFTSPATSFTNFNGVNSTDRVDFDVISYRWSIDQGAIGYIEGRYSLDGGTTWSSWMKMSGIGLTSGVVPLNVDTSQLYLQYRVTLVRGRPTVNIKLIDFNWDITKSYYDYSTNEEQHIDFTTHKIQPVMSIKMKDGQYLDFPLGIFHLSSPTAVDETKTIRREIDCYDSLVILNEDKITKRVTFYQGDKYIDRVKDVLASSGIGKVNIPDSSLTIPRTVEYKPGTSKLSIINDLLTQINYTQIWVDSNGYFTSSPYVAPDNKGITWEYKDDELSVIVSGMSDEIDLFNQPNVFTVVVSNTDNAVMSYTIENYDIGLTSINSVKRKVVDYREQSDIADYATLQAFVERIFTESLQIIEKIEFETAIMPFHEYLDTLFIQYTDLGIYDKFSEYQWSFTCKPGEKMKHVARRVIPVDIT